jgi:L-malate glycosyltransferase
MKKSIKEVVRFLFSNFNFLLFNVLYSYKIKKSEFVFFFPYYHTGGAERVHISILEALKNKKNTVIFTHGSATKSLYKEFEKNAQIIELNPILNKKNNRIDESLQNKIVKKINSSKTIKAVFGCNTKYYYKIIARLDPKIKKIDLFHAFEKNDSRVDDIIASVSIISHRIVINQRAKDTILKYYQLHGVSNSETNKIRIIQNGINLPETVLKNKDDTNIKIGFVGRWSPEKRPELFLKIAQNIKSILPNISFIMAGTGMKSNLELIMQYGVGFIGEITNEKELISLYESLHFVVLTSEYEGFPMVFMESMCYGVIPVTTNVGGISEHVTHLENGILINETQDDKIVSVACQEILGLLANSESKKTMAQSCYNYAFEHFGNKNFENEYQKLFFET